MMRAAGDLRLAIHPMRTPPTPQNIPIHPLSRRYQPDHSAAPQAAPQCPPQQLSQQQELYANKLAERNANQVRSDVDDEANEAKDTTTATTTTNNSQQPITPKIQPIRSATERLKWKFLGW